MINLDKGLESINLSKNNISNASFPQNNQN